MKRNLLALLFGTVLALVLLETALRILPTSDATEALDVNDANPWLRYQPDRTLFVSIGRFFEIRNTKRTNDLGFFTDRRTTDMTSGPRIALIGDSFVEARQVANDEAVQARLEHHLGGDAAVFAFAFSGSPLSQYLAYAALADATVAPDLFVVVVIANDYDESLLRHHFMPGHHYFDDEGRLVRVDATTSLAKRLLRHSAIARYLALNLGLQNWLTLPRIEAGAYVANMPRHVPEERLAASRMAADQFLAQLQERAGERPVLLVLDAIREAIYTGWPLDAYADSFVHKMNRHLADRAVARGFHVLDLQPVFAADHAAHGERFEFPIDNHWNARGHDVAANAIAAAITGLGLLPAEP